MSVSNTTSNTTPLPVSADATDAALLQISDEAREAARDNFGPPVCGHGVLTLERHEKRIQLAINSATEKLQRENEHLKKALALKLDEMPSGLSAGQSIKLEQERDQLSAELLATQAQVEQLKTAIKEASRILMREGYPSSASALQSTLSLTPTTAIAPIVEAHLKSLKALEEYDRLVANGDFYFNCKAHLSVPAQAANKHALQLLGVKEEK